MPTNKRRELPRGWAFLPVLGMVAILSVLNRCENIELEDRILQIQKQVEIIDPEKLIPPGR